MSEYWVFAVVATYLWAGDLYLNRGQDMTVTRAASWSLMYVVAAMAFAVWLYFTKGPQQGQLFLTAYTLEKVLSVDNLMVFSAVFAHFQIRPRFRHRILRWGIIGAAAMRSLFVYFGIEVYRGAQAFVEIGFSVLIMFAAAGMLRGEEEADDLSKKWYIRKIQNMHPLYLGPGQDETFLKHCSYIEVNPGQWSYRETRPHWCFTPALLCLIAIEITDLIFSVDSVPVVIAVTNDKFIAYSAMIYAVMGLRAMFFVLDALQRLLVYLKYAVALALTFIAVKLVLHAVTGMEIESQVSMSVVVGLLGLGALASLLIPKRPEP